MRTVLRALVDIARDVWLRGILTLIRLIPGHPGNPLTEPLRLGLVALTGASVGAGSQLSPGFFLFRSGRFRAGAGCRFGYAFQVWNFEQFVVGDRLLASHGVKIVCATHKVTARREDVAGPVSIGNDVWLGADVTIVGPCEIGDGVVVGAKSFVSGHLDAGWVYAGVPARKIRPVGGVAPPPTH